MAEISSDVVMLIPRSFDEVLGLSRLIEACYPQIAKCCRSTADVIRY